MAADLARHYTTGLFLSVSRLRQFSHLLWHHTSTVAHEQARSAGVLRGQGRELGGTSDRRRMKNEAVRKEERLRREWDPLPVLRSDPAALCNNTLYQAEHLDSVTLGKLFDTAVGYVAQFLWLSIS
ncbi:unnamed protein product [Pleuronectes platessa]|uniref:Uncharacterized protein n=1 Tax=Pleuronectes platessa TaxID=8262 RepID=A0A9N7TK00_PLEPL|nr:unnamed protein product [Pleuronectes platessa]